MEMSDLNKLFINKGRTLGSVESFTGGEFASRVTSISGASHFFKGSLVTYFTEEKVRLLDIPYSLVDEHGVVSKEIAGEMATRGRITLGVDYCVSFTGNAGPMAMEGKPVGEIYIGIAVYNHTYVFPFNLQGDRNSIRNQAIELASTMLMAFLEEKN